MNFYADRDSAGQERFRAIAGNYYKGSHGLCVCFDLTNAKSFESLPSWLKEMEQHTDGDPKLLLIGTKVDLSKKRAVLKDIAKQFADQHGMMYIETSAKDCINVQESFETITRQLLNE